MIGARIGFVSCIKRRRIPLNNVGAFECVPSLCCIEMRLFSDLTCAYLACEDEYMENLSVSIYNL